jgi:ABC-2 type transport system ATP-binding protein
MPIVSLEGVSKKYRIFPSRRDKVKSALTLGKSKAGRNFLALKNIDLELEPGTALGILGRNGAGKSTLLKLISGVVQPTSGSVKVNGRLVALLQLGAGFDDEFTGRENVMLNGLILGIDRHEMLERLDEIEAFAEIGEFINQPLKTYSSGMRARLGFAVAVNVKPDILLVDESLATGDAVFKAKGIQKMRELRDSGVTILFVSHSTQQVKDFCTEAILIHKGRLISQGSTSEVADEYEALLANAAAQRKNKLGLDQPLVYEIEQDIEDRLIAPDYTASPTPDNKSSGLRHGTGDARIQNVELLDENGNAVDLVEPGTNPTVRVHVQYTKDVDDSAIGIVLRNDSGLDVFSTNTALEETPVGRMRAGEQIVVDFTFPMLLKQGRYSIAASVSLPGSKGLYLDWISVTTVFRVSRPSDRGAFPGLVHLPTQIKIIEPERVQKHEPPAQE